MIETVAKNLRAMPFNEMMDLARYISERLHVHSTGRPASPELIAEILSHISAPPSEAAQKETKILLQAFTRQRTINIKKFNTGYAIEVKTLPGSTVTGTDLRVMFGQMLDQIVTMELMGGGSTRVR